MIAGARSRCTPICLAERVSPLRAGPSLLRQDDGVALFYDCNDASVRSAALSAAAHCISSGQLVVLPTDTVYGVGADAFDSSAITELLAAKGRARDMPVPVLVGSWTTIEGLVSSVAQRTWDLIE